MNKIKVLFVGSFIEKAKDGSVGGQMFACRSLITSELKNKIDWVLLDTTGDSVPPPSIYIRMINAIKRIIKFIYLLILKKPKYSIIFSANGPSIYEKGLMVFIANIFGVKGIFAPRGGAIVNEIKSSPFLNWYLRFTLNQSKFIVCQGKYFQNFLWNLNTKNSLEKFVVIPNWIDLNFYNVSKFRLNEKDTLKILYMGWIQEDKGVHDIFMALDLLPEINQKIEFIFLGDGPSKNHFIQETQSGKYPFSFSFPGWVHGDEKLAYLANADIFILASHAEGMPNSLMEAMLCGIACIATDVGTVSDLIINGETGILVKKQNIKELADAILKLISDDSLRLKYSIEGKNRIISNHSIVAATESFNKIII